MLSEEDEGMCAFGKKTKPSIARRSVASMRLIGAIKALAGPTEISSHKNVTITAYQIV